MKQRPQRPQAQGRPQQRLRYAKGGLRPPGGHAGGQCGGGGNGQGQHHVAVLKGPPEMQQGGFGDGEGDADRYRAQAQAGGQGHHALSGDAHQAGDGQGAGCAQRRAVEQVQPRQAAHPFDHVVKVKAAADRTGGDGCLVHGNPAPALPVVHHRTRRAEAERRRGKRRRPHDRVMELSTVMADAAVPQHADAQRRRGRPVEPVGADLPCRPGQYAPHRDADRRSGEGTTRSSVQQC